MPIYRHLEKFKYDTSLYNFKECLCDIYQTQDLSQLHKKYSEQISFNSHDSSSPLHKLFYNLQQEKLSTTYLQFLKNVIYPILGEPFYYQLVPCIRLGFPGRKWLDRYHLDSDYNHPIYELNINLVISPTSMTSSQLRIEEAPGSGNYLFLDQSYGEFCFINHIGCLHGSEVNTSDETFCSIDFRLILEKDENVAFSSTKSVNTKKKFMRGSYFSSEALSL